MIATWCQRDNEAQPFTPKEEKKLDFLYSEWTHPYFISINVSFVGGPRWASREECSRIRSLTEITGQTILATGVAFDAGTISVSLKTPSTEGTPRE